MYYPKSQIITNLYTPGNEFQVASTGEVYRGYYHKVSSGKHYTGKTTTDSPTRLIIPIEKNEFGYDSQTIDDTSRSPYSNTPRPSLKAVYSLNEDYLKATSQNYLQKDISAPVDSKQFPTSKDYDLGQYQRYFLKKINTPLFKEVSKERYDQYFKKDPNVQYDLYFPFKFIWVITGDDKNKVANVNYNTLVLTEKKFKVKGLVKYFKNKYTQYLNANKTSSKSSGGY